TKTKDNPYAFANIIANPTTQIEENHIDTSRITQPLLAKSLHGIGEIDTNVATGFHVIEFLLWGQDLNGNTTGAGQRPATDYALDNCTGGHCERRREYLKA